jgi:hypothetical protein
MEYVVNERFFERVLEIKADTDAIVGNNDETIRYIASNIRSEEDAIKLIFSGYLDAMENGAKLAKVDLDMTYETAQNLMPSVIMLAHLQKEQEYDNQKNAELVAKTLAAYLTMLAINNHKVKVAVGAKANRLKENRPEYWSDKFYLRLNNKTESDLLPYIVAGINASPIEVDNGFTLEISPLLGAYRRITGVDLQEYGFVNLVISFDDLAEGE